MELKKAVGVCLISFFAATMVVLIARWLDNRAADRIEPQLAAIVEELRAIRRQGLTAATSNDTNADEADIAGLDAGLTVYYFHGNTRCPTCEAIESQAHNLVKTDFADELKSGKMVWKAVNYEKSAALTKKYEISMPVVVLALMKDGQVERWERLDRVWPLVGDKPAFEKYVREQIENIRKPPTPPAIPLPDEPAFPEFKGSTP